MRRALAVAFTALAVGLMLTLTAVYSYAQPLDFERLEIITEHYPPYNFRAESGQLQGISVDLLLAMSERIGASLEREAIELLPWARGYRQALEQPYTMLFATTRTQERENLFKWVGPIAATKVGLTALKARQLTINGPADLKRLRLGAIRDDVGMQLLEKYGVAAAEQQLVARNRQNIEKLLRGRIDAWAYEESVAAWDIAQSGHDSDQFEVVYTLSSEYLYYAFHRTTPETIIAPLQAALDELRREGVYERILQRYVGATLP